MSEVQIWGGPHDGQILRVSGDPLTINYPETPEFKPRWLDQPRPPRVIGDRVVTEPYQPEPPDNEPTWYRSLPVVKHENGKRYALWVDRRHR